MLPQASPIVETLASPSVSIKLGWLEASGSGALGIIGLVVLVGILVFAGWFMRGELSRFLKRRDIL